MWSGFFFFVSYAQTKTMERTGVLTKPVKTAIRIHNTYYYYVYCLLRQIKTFTFSGPLFRYTGKYGTQ